MRPKERRDFLLATSAGVVTLFLLAWPHLSDPFIADECNVRQRFRRYYFPDEPPGEVKLDQDDVSRICQRVVDHDLDTGLVAEQFDVSQRRVQQLAKEYRDSGKIPQLETPGREPYAEYPDDLEDRVLELLDSVCQNWDESRLGQSGDASRGF